MIRRCVDLVVAAVGLVLVTPLLLLAAAAIWATMGSPVLFSQQRSGLGGEVFTIYKLRTMRTPRYPAQPDVARTPRLGAVLRALSVDELPQLWNVLVGDMSLIGPRPTLPEQVARYDARQRRRLEVRPGITGWAQVKGRNHLSWPERIELDIWYVDHRSPWVDLRILGLTVLQLVRPRGVTGPGGVNPDFPSAPAAEASEPPR